MKTKIRVDKTPPATFDSYNLVSTERQDRVGDLHSGRTTNGKGTFRAPSSIEQDTPTAGGFLQTTNEKESALDADDSIFKAGDSTILCNEM